MKKISKTYYYCSDCVIYLGHNSLKFIFSIGRITIFVKNLLYAFSKPFFIKNTLWSFFTIGFCSIPVVSLTGIFTGAVLALQLYYGFMKFGVTEIIPTIVLISMLKELGPVLCGLMISARVGSSITAEIGGMVVTNQIDALITLRANPFRFLFLPRFLATTISMSLLTIIIAIIGVLGSYIVSVYYFDFPAFNYLQLTVSAFDWHDFYIGIVKATTFGIGISTIACYNGYTVKNGATGIGQATVKTVVMCCIMILFLNFVITERMR